MSEIDDLSRTVGYVGLGGWSMTARELQDKGRRAAGKDTRSRSAFFDESRRQKPSLPKLKFLEGKD